MYVSFLESMSFAYRSSRALLSTGCSAVGEKFPFMGFIKDKYSTLPGVDIPGFAKSTYRTGDLAAWKEGCVLLSLEGCGLDKKPKQPGVDLWKDRAISSISLRCSFSHSRSSTSSAPSCESMWVCGYGEGVWRCVGVGRGCGGCVEVCECSDGEGFLVYRCTCIQYVDRCVCIVRAVAVCAVCGA